jgi:hypothetical protein
MRRAKFARSLSDFARSLSDSDVSFRPEGTLTVINDDMNLSDLPDELLAISFARLNDAERCPVRLACRRFNTLIMSGFPQLFPSSFVFGRFAVNDKRKDRSYLRQFLMDEKRCMTLREVRSDFFYHGIPRDRYHRPVHNCTMSEEADNNDLSRFGMVLDACPNVSSVQVNGCVLSGDILLVTVDYDVGNNMYRLLTKHSREKITHMTLDVSCIVRQSRHLQTLEFNYSSLQYLHLRASKRRYRILDTIPPLPSLMSLVVETDPLKIVCGRTDLDVDELCTHLLDGFPDELTHDEAGDAGMAVLDEAVERAFAKCFHKDDCQCTLTRPAYDTNVLKRLVARCPRLRKLGYYDFNNLHLLHDLRQLLLDWAWDNTKPISPQPFDVICLADNSTGRHFYKDKEGPHEDGVVHFVSSSERLKLFR